MPPRPDGSRRSLLEIASNPIMMMMSTSSSDELESESGVLPKATGFYFLSSVAQRNLPHFQYCGQDLSLLYNHVLSPLAGFLVGLLPRNVAPNTITLVGLLFMVSAYLIFWAYSPDLAADASGLPRWIFLWNCVSMVLYQTFDNMDGKQARRTGSTSPLGLLFDHGCDAINSLFGSVNWIVAMALNPRQNSLACWILLLGPYSLFFVGTWEEYYTGSLVLPIVNGPNEGLLGGALLSLTSFWWGPMYWQETTWSTNLASFVGAKVAVPILRNADWIVFASLFGFMQECVLKITNVIRRFGLQAAKTLLPFATLLGCTLTLMVSDPTWFLMPRTFLHLVASLFVEMTTALMLAHMCGTPYRAWRWTVLPLLALTASSVASNGRVPLNVWVWYAAASCTYLALKTCLVIHEICELLQIWCFDIVSKRRGDPIKTE
jgi:ethanolaminephosphotransferase